MKNNNDNFKNAGVLMQASFVLLKGVKNSV